MYAAKEQDKAMKFLMRLNEMHYQVRSQALVIDPMLSLRKIYNTIKRNENKQGIQRSPYQESSGMYVAPKPQANDSSRPGGFIPYNPPHTQNQNRQRTSTNDGQNTEEKSNLLCTYRQLLRHMKMCYRVIDSLHGYQNRRNPDHNNYRSSNCAVANNVITGSFPEGINPKVDE